MGRHFEVRAASMAKTAAVKAKLYSRYGKEILMAAKSGVPDPDMNASLKKVIERAKANQVPADVIKRAIEKAKGGTNENYSAATYEGFGAGGQATIIIDCLTDNANRTIADLRGCFNKSHAKIGVSGCVSFNYEHVGLISIKYDDEEAMMDALIMAEVDLKDIEVEEGQMTITVEPTELNKAKDAIEELIPEVSFDILEDTMLPNEYVELEGEDLMRFQRLGITRSQHFHIAFKDHFAVNFELRHYAVNGFVQLGCVSGVIPVKIGLLIMGCQQLRFGIDAAPVIRERQIDGRFQVNTGCFRHVVSGVNKVHCLAVNACIKRTNIILVVVNV